MDFLLIDYIMYGLQLFMDFQFMDFQFIDYIIYGLGESSKKKLEKRGQADRFGPCHPLTWTQRKSHRFGQGAHVYRGKSERDPAELVLTFKTWALYSVRCPCPKSGLLPILGRTLHSTFLQLSTPNKNFAPLRWPEMRQGPSYGTTFSIQNLWLAFSLQKLSCDFAEVSLVYEDG